MLASFTIGQGPHATVLLHGFLGSGRNLRTLAVRWAERDPSRTFLLIDLTGHGDSPPLPQSPSLATLATDVLETARASGLKAPYSVVGHSLGGRVALECLRQAKSELSDVVLLDISPSAIDPKLSESARVLDKLRQAPAEAPSRVDMREALLATGLSPALGDWLLTNLVSRGGRVTWKIDREALQRFHVKALGEELWELVDPSPVPLLCVRGGRAQYVTDADAARLARAGAQVETLDSGHYVHVDALEPLLELLVRFGATS